MRKIIFIATGSALAVLLLGIIFAQGRTISDQEQKINAHKKIILTNAKRSSSSQASLRALKGSAQQIKSDFDSLQEERSAGEGELNSLKQKIEELSQAKNVSQKKAAILEESNDRLEAQVSGLKAELAGGIGAEAAAQEKPKPVKNETSKLQKEIGRLGEENAALYDQNKQLKADKNNLEDASAKLAKINTQLESKAKKLFLEAKDRQELQEQVKELNKAVDILSKERIIMAKNIERLQNNAADLKLENASLYAKAGDAYMQAGLTDDGIKSFNDALRLNPKNADAHYKLGFLYKRSINNNLKAVYHFKNYLALEPNAKNRKEVEYLIQLLSQDDWEKD